MNRYKWIDILRALAIIYVVLGHTLSAGTVQNYIWSFQIPLFFFISGMLFKDKEKSFKAYFFTKFKQLMIPYFTFGIICIVIFAVMGRFAASSLNIDGLSFDLKTNLAGLLYGSAKTGNLKFNLPLWFLPCLFSVSIIYYFVNHLVKDNNKLHLLIVVLFAITGYIINYHTNISTLPFGLDTAITMLVFYSLGQYYFKYINSLFSKPIYCLLILVGAIVGIFNGRIQYSADVYNNILLFYISSLCGIAGHISLAKLIDHNRILEYIGKNTLVILVLHKLPILFFQTVIPFTKSALRNNNLFVAIIVSLIAIASCLIAGIVIDKIMPFSLGHIKKN